LDVKLTAAQADPSLRIFLYPDLSLDMAMGTIPAEEIDRCQQALFRIDRRLQAVAVNNAAQVLPFLVDDCELALASLQNGYFAHSFSTPVDNGPVAQAIQFLLKDNADRFTSSLGQKLQLAENDDIHKLLEAYAKYHIRRREYPSGFGVTLHHLVHAVPPLVVLHDLAFPMLSHGSVFALGGLARGGDQQDAVQLVETCFGRHLATDSLHHPESNEIDGAPSEADMHAAVEYALREISADSFNRKIGVKIDQARSSFLLPSIVAGSHREVLDTGTAFYRHVLAQTRLLPVPADDDLVAAEAFRLLRDAFAEYGGYQAAEAEALRPTHGGLSLVPNRMTDQVKKELFFKHVDRVLKEAIDPIDSGRQVEFLRALMSHLGDQLPEDVRNRPLTDFLERREELVKHVVHLLDRLAETFRGI
jgi:hypothetical protein